MQIGLIPANCACSQLIEKWVLVTSALSRLAPLPLSRQLVLSGLVRKLFGAGMLSYVFMRRPTERLGPLGAIAAVAKMMRLSRLGGDVGWTGIAPAGRFAGTLPA